MIIECSCGWRFDSAKAPEYLPAEYPRQAISRHRRLGHNVAVEEKTREATGRPRPEAQAPADS
jgi:hypothetical protein